jgi:hypothetical protein
MTIEPITRAEFESMGQIRTGRPRSPEYEAIAGLSPGGGFKVPCRWNHTGHGPTCGGASLAMQVSRRAGIRVATRCKDKVLYVLRVA